MRIFFFVRFLTVVFAEIFWLSICLVLYPIISIDESSIERLNIESCWINTGNNTDNSDHTRLLKFFDNVAQYHMQSVQTLYPDQTYIENGIKSLYSLFLPSCRQYVADDAKIDQLTTNPKNEENKKKETSATNQIEK